MFRIYIIGLSQPEPYEPNDAVAEILYRWRMMPTLYEKTMVIVDESRTVDPANASKPFVHITGPIDTTDTDLVTLADYFNQIIDVEIRFSWGPTVSREKGKGFGTDAIREAHNKIHEVLVSAGCCHHH